MSKKVRYHAIPSITQSTRPKTPATNAPTTPNACCPCPEAALEVDAGLLVAPVVEDAGEVVVLVEEGEVVVRVVVGTVVKGVVVTVVSVAVLSVVVVTSLVALVASLVADAKEASVRRDCKGIVSTYLHRIGRLGEPGPVQPRLQCSSQ
jgi:hypothetical protein